MLKFNKDQKKSFDRTKLVKNLGRNRILVPYLDKAFLGFNDSWSFTYEPKQTDSAWHPSGDCTPSVTDLYARAQQWLEWHANPPAETAVSLPTMQKNFMVGHYWHQLIQYVVVKIGLAKSDAIERVGSKVWGAEDPIIPASWPDVHTDYRGFPAYRKEDLYYLRYPEQTIRDNKGKIIGENDAFMKLVRTWPDSGYTPEMNNLKIRPRPFHWVRGQGDIVPLKTPEWEGLVDIKTMGSYAFKQTTLPPQFAAKYVCQMNIYMDLFNQEQAIILGVNKDSPHDFKEISFVRNQTLIDALFERWYYVGECLDKGTAPTESDNDKYTLPEIKEVDNT